MGSMIFVCRVSVIATCPYCEDRTRINGSSFSFLDGPPSSLLPLDVRLFSMDRTEDKVVNVTSGKERGSARTSRSFCLSEQTP